MPVRIANLIAGGKNLGTTHITNGCYRLHPIEWNVGEAAGALAAFALDERVPPASVRERPALLERFQRGLVREGVPLAWLVDVGVAHPAFAGSQHLYVRGAAAAGRRSPVPPGRAGARGGMARVRRHRRRAGDPQPGRATAGGDVVAYSPPHGEGIDMTPEQILAIPPKVLTQAQREFYFSEGYLLRRARDR